MSTSRPSTITKVPVCALAVLLPAITTSGQDPTDVSELTMYVVNNEVPNRLLRVNWGSENVHVVGEVVTADGIRTRELESFTHIPAGPNSGFYAPENYDDSDRVSRLVRIDPFTGEARFYPQEIGFGYVIGMVSAKRAGTDTWVILATHRGSVDGHGPKVSNLLVIDPAGDGRGEVVMKLASGNTYQGLAMADDGTLLAVNREKRGGRWLARLWEIRPDWTNPAGGTETPIGAEVEGRVETLEFAFGKLAAQIDVPGVPTSWTEKGALIGFNDSTDQYLIFNSNPADPLYGHAVAFSPPFEISPLTTDCEGLVFFAVDPYEGVHAGWD